LESPRQGEPEKAKITFFKKKNSTLKKKFQKKNFFPRKKKLKKKFPGKKNFFPKTKKKFSPKKNNKKKNFFPKSAQEGCRLQISECPGGVASSFSAVGHGSSRSGVVTPSVAAAPVGAAPALAPTSC
jgi:hypothetical protein